MFHACCWIAEYLQRERLFAERIQNIKKCNKTVTKNRVKIWRVGLKCCPSKYLPIKASSLSHSCNVYRGRSCLCIGILFALIFGLPLPRSSGSPLPVLPNDKALLLASHCGDQKLSVL